MNGFKWTKCSSSNMTFNDDDLQNFSLFQKRRGKNNMKINKRKKIMIQFTIKCKAKYAMVHYLTQ